MTDDEIIRSFPKYEGSGVPGFVINFLGIRTRISYVSTLASHNGVVEDYPIPMNFHATALEWAGGLRAVLDATTEFVALELGAGWAPWLVSLARAAEIRGIQGAILVGVEGSIQHVDHMHSHFIDNGLDPKRHMLLHGVVGLRDGTAEFPIQSDPSADYGTAGVFSERSGLSGWFASRRISRAILATINSRAGGSARHRMERVKCVSLPTLLRPFRTVDLVHVDIQGDEYKVISGAHQILKEKVKRIIVGTHSRFIEQQLLDDLASHLWILEAEETCRYEQAGPRMRPFLDGCQVWWNPAYGSCVRGARRTSDSQ